MIKTSTFKLFPFISECVCVWMLISDNKKSEIDYNQFKETETVPYYDELSDFLVVTFT